jgi:hypothetical protein
MRERNALAIVVMLATASALSAPPGGEYGDAPNLGITIVGYTESDTVQRFIAPSRNWGP